MADIYESPFTYRDGRANGRAAWRKNCADRANGYLVDVLRVKDPAPWMGARDLGFVDGVRFEQRATD